MKYFSDTNFKTGFTLLELLIVVTLIAVVFTVAGMVFVNNLKSFSLLSSSLNENAIKLGFINQLTSQLFSKYEGRTINFLATKDGISFYTYYPVIYEGVVRAEYRFNKEEDGAITVIYEEFPYPDNKLGHAGLKKVFIGRFRQVEIEFLENNSWKTGYKSKNFPEVIKVDFGDAVHYITVNVKD
ncbi:prepilin-type N-terminal cleavage/methylation domain-containing protein [Persephonella atlantica]|uniref:Prepilin-type N-terminal cleavage/methylation domain-containing protein n=1 Tax=Persephonella atlantica TaxID=2699429 RepID=A0ABS1GH96_9AQUI|nr:prepilin-type N-terminal cleavage/methylation domain-containing protein [Persephonella atlantica]MBK3332297.1 prepilin-type N-terminal cleavage/methylation domain-containing protein [Persephonella atlantica]